MVPEDFRDTSRGRVSVWLSASLSVTVGSSWTEEEDEDCVVGGGEVAGSETEGKGCVGAEAIG
jgi:hypothetical protein